MLLMDDHVRMAYLHHTKVVNPNFVGQRNPFFAAFPVLTRLM
jgi:hypothetical protein